MSDTEEMNEIEHLIAANEIGMHKVFTRMKAIVQRSLRNAELSERSFRDQYQHTLKGRATFDALHKRAQEVRLLLWQVKECRNQAVGSNPCGSAWDVYRLDERIDLAIGSDLPTKPEPGQHTDDVAVDCFAEAMKEKLAKARGEGKVGWSDPFCSDEFLAEELVKQLTKGNAGTFEDIANFAMMLHQRGADPKVLLNAATAQPAMTG